MFTVVSVSKHRILLKSSENSAVIKPRTISSGCKRLLLTQTIGGVKNPYYVAKLVEKTDLESLVDQEFN